MKAFFVYGEQAYDVSVAQRAAVALSRRPDDFSAGNVAWRIAEEFGNPDIEVVTWQLVDELPPWVNIGLADQLAAHKRDSGEDACYMIVMMGTEDELRGID